MKKRVAPYNTKCRACGRAITKGETVYFAKHEGARCLGCGPSSAANPPPSIPASPGKPVRRNPSPTKKTQPEPEPKAKAPAVCPPAVRGADGVYRFGWESVAELVNDAFGHDAAQSESAAAHIRAFVGTHIKNGRGDTWVNDQSPETLMKAVTTPDRKLLVAIDEMREALAGEIPLPTAPRRRVRHGREDGDELDPDRWLARLPNGWDRCEREPRPCGTVGIHINLSVNHKQKPAELLYRGAAACALADVLVAQGRNVEITGFMSAVNLSQCCKKLVTRVVLKSADMPLDLAAVATAACDIGFFRLAVVPATARHALGNLALGFGHPASLPVADLGGADFAIGLEVTSKAAAVNWLRTAVQKFLPTAPEAQ